MSVIVISEYTCKECMGEQFIEFCRKAFPDTRKFKGCESIRLSVDLENPRLLVMTQQWVSKECHQEYLRFRMNDGTQEEVNSMCVGRPIIRYLNLTNT